MANIERTYVDLIFASSRKYAAWDPEITIKVGDYGHITRGKPGLAFWRKRRGIFLKAGNIYDDGKAAELSIPEPKPYGQEAAAEGITWLTSKNAQENEFSADISAQTPALATCGVKASFKFSSGSGAILAMENDTITTIDPPGSLRLLMDRTEMLDKVVVSEVHSCAAYARYLGTPSVKSVAIGLSAQPPVANVGSVDVEAKWVRSTSSGNFKARVNKSGDRTYYPLFRLVSLKDEGVSNGLRSGMDDEMSVPLPDAMPPWAEDSDEKSEKGPMRIPSVFRRKSKLSASAPSAQTM